MMRSNVAGFDPMNRGLKVSRSVKEVGREIVAGFDPMNRGLKENSVFRQPKNLKMLQDLTR